MNCTPDLLSSAIKTLAALITVLGGLLLLFYLVKRINKKNADGTRGNLIKVISTSYIGIKKNILLVEVPGSVLVIGTSGDNMCLLTKIEGEAMGQIRDIEQTKKPLSFLDQLHRFSEKYRHNSDKE